MYYEDQRMLKTMQTNMSSHFVPTTSPCPAPSPHPGCQLTVIHDVHAQPQPCPRVSTCAGQQSTECQAQDPQHGFTCAMGPELEAAHQSQFPLEASNASDQTGPSEWSPRSRTLWIPANSANLIPAFQRRQGVSRLNPGPLESPQAAHFSL